MLDDVEAAMDLCEECMCNQAFYECERCGKQLCEDCAYFNPDEDDSEEEPTVYCEDCYRELFELESDSSDV